jgi:hypothetical protein
LVVGILRKTLRMAPLQQGFQLKSTFFSFFMAHILLQLKQLNLLECYSTMARIIFFSLLTLQLVVSGGVVHEGLLLEVLKNIFPKDHI